jgi:PAS domain S-box-containing protein
MKSDWRQSLRSMAVLATAGLGIALVSIGLLYNVSLHQQGLRLLGMVREQARMIEAMTAHETQKTGADSLRASDDDAFEAVIGQLRTAQSKLHGLGQTGELYVARREGDSIVYLLAHRGQSLVHPARMAFGGVSGEPMYRALTGRSGAGVLRDYRGVKVLAAYEPINVFNLGIVAGIDLAEVRSPFLRADLIVLAATLIFVVGGGLLLLLVSAPERRRLRESEERNRLLLRNANDAVLVHRLLPDRPGVIVEVNDRACAMYGYSHEEFIGLGIDAIEVPEQTARSQLIVAELISTGHSTFTTDALAKGGRRVPVEISARLVTLGGEPMVLALVRDISERKQNEAELERYRKHLEELVAARTTELKQTQDQLVMQEKLATLGRVAGTIAHELRNPLGVIRNASFYLQATVADKLEGKPLHHLQTIDQHVERANAAITMILDFTWRQRGEPKKYALRPLMERAVAEAAIPATVYVLLEVEPNLPEVFVDGRQMVTVFRNLFVNAAQAMPVGGTLRAVARREGSMVTVDVADTGSGITPEHFARLFEPLFTTKVIGLGLGLAICKVFVEANNGTISVVSDVGKGTTVTLTLPTTGEQDTNSKSQGPRTDHRQTPHAGLRSPTDVGNHKSGLGTRRLNH